MGSTAQPEVTSFLRLPEAPKEFHTVLSTIHAFQCAYFIHCTAYSLLTLISSRNNIFYLLINELHHYYVIYDVIIQKNIAFSAVSQNKLRLHKKNLFSSAVQ